MRPQKSDHWDNGNIVDVDFRSFRGEEVPDIAPRAQGAWELVDEDEEGEEEPNDTPNPEPLIVTIGGWQPPQFTSKRASDYLRESADLLQVIEDRARGITIPRRPSWRDRLWSSRTCGEKG